MNQHSNDEDDDTDGCLPAHGRNEDAALDAQARIERLEEALAHLIRASEDMSAIIARQDTDLIRVTRRVEMLMRREAEREMDAGAGTPLADQRPPHW